MKRDDFLDQNDMGLYTHSRVIIKGLCWMAWRKVKLNCLPLVEVGNECTGQNSGVFL